MNHTHNINDITGYEPYDDTEIMNFINNKGTSETHNTARIIHSAIIASQPSSGTLSSHANGIKYVSDWEYNPTGDIYLNNDKLPLISLSREYDDNGKCRKTIMFNVIGRSVSDYNNTISYNYGDGSFALPLSLSYQSTSVYNPSNDNRLITQRQIIDLMYPVGSIYVSLTFINPNIIFGGTWQQIIDRFLYCSDVARVKDGSRKISTAQLPAHDHGFKDYTFTWHWGRTYAEPYHVHAMATCADGASNDNYIHTQPEEHNRTRTAGSGADYMPEYMTVYAWFRVS